MTLSQPTWRLSQLVLSIFSFTGAVHLLACWWMLVNIFTTNRDCFCIDFKSDPTSLTLVPTVFIFSLNMFAIINLAARDFNNNTLSRYIKLILSQCAVQLFSFGLIALAVSSDLISAVKADGSLVSDIEIDTLLSVRLLSSSIFLIPFQSLLLWFSLSTLMSDTKSYDQALSNA